MCFKGHNNGFYGCRRMLRWWWFEKWNVRREFGVGTLIDLKIKSSGVIEGVVHPSRWKGKLSSNILSDKFCWNSFTWQNHNYFCSCNSYPSVQEVVPMSVVTIDFFLYYSIESMLLFYLKVSNIPFLLSLCKCKLYFLWVCF